MSGSSVDVPAWSITLNGASAGNSMQVASINFTEGVSHQIPRISIVVQDIEQRWQNHAFAMGKDTIDLALGYQGQPLVPCGNFTLDGRGLAIGKPDQFTLNASEAGLGLAIRTRNSVAYEGKTLTGIADQVAAKHGLQAITEAVNPDPVFKRKTQRMETDLSFLARLATENGYDFVIRNGKLIFYSHTSLLNQQTTDPVITRPTLIVDECEFHDQRLAPHAFGQASAIYHNPHHKKLYHGSAVNTSVSSADQHKLVARYENGQQAALAAQSNLLASNEITTVARMQIPGTLHWRAGNTVKMQSFGTWDASAWLVHELRADMTNERGYVTTLTLHAVTKDAETTSQSMPTDLPLPPTPPAQVPQ